MDNNTTPMSDDRVREGVKHFGDTLRKIGIIGDMASTVGEDREAGPGQPAPKDGLAPMVRSVPQADR